MPMRNIRPNCRGITLVEVVLASSLLAALMLVGSVMWHNLAYALHSTQVHNALQLEVTTGMDTMVHFLSEAKWNTVKISGTNTYPWSTITCTLIDPSNQTVNYKFQQTTDHKVTMTVGNGNRAPSTIIDNVATFTLNFPRSNDPSLLNITLVAQASVDKTHKATIFRTAQVKFLAPAGS